MPVPNIKAIRQAGTHLAEADFEHHTIGPCQFIWHDDWVRRFQVGDTEILRGLAVVIRDANWGTHRLASRRNHTRVRNDSVHIDYHADVPNRAGHGDGSQLGIRLQVVVNAQGLDAWLTLTAHTDFETCRSGLSTLLPLKHVVGREVLITHTDGTHETGELPYRVSPGQPFFDIHRLRYAPDRQQPVEFHFEGDTFEMEDQRNWSDASFKIYNRPLALPAPYLIQAGETVEQHIRLRLQNPDTIQEATT